MDFATLLGVPAFSRFRTHDRLKSWKSAVALLVTPSIFDRHTEPSGDACLVGHSMHEPDPGELSHLLAGLVAFLAEHRYCGELDGGAEDERIWMTCTCGAVISRVLEPAQRP